jgi:hypothetical protein
MGTVLKIWDPTRNSWLIRKTGSIGGIRTIKICTDAEAKLEWDGGAIDAGTWMAL